MKNVTLAALLLLSLFSAAYAQTMGSVDLPTGQDVNTPETLSSAINTALAVKVDVDHGVLNTATLNDAILTGTITTPITGTTQCLQVDAAGVMSGTGVACQDLVVENILNTMLSGNNTFTASPQTIAAGVTGAYKIQTTGGIAATFFADDASNTYGISDNATGNNTIACSKNTDVCTFGFSPIVGTLTPGTNSTQAASAGFVQNALSGYLPLTGGTVTGPVNVTAEVQADVFAPSVATGISALGSSQSDAELLRLAYNDVASVNSGTGVILQGGSNFIGVKQCVWNDGANDLNVYPAVGLSIMTSAVNTPDIITAGTDACFIELSATVGYKLAVP